MIMNSSGEWIWLPGVDIDGDSKVSIIDEYIPRQTGVIDILTSPMNPTHRWFQSYFELDSTLSMIGNVSCSVLIQQGEDDVQTPVQEAFLLDQRLTDVGHADHSVISYSGLGHTFYPVNGWRQPLGPMGEEVLADLAAWLTDPARKVHILDSKLQTATYTIEELQGQLGDLNSELDQQTSRLEDQITELIAESTDIQSSVIELERQNMEFQLVLDSTKNMTYIAFGVALIAVLSGVVIMIQNRKS